MLFLAGTSDARALAVRLAARYDVLATVVTDSAAKSLTDKGIPTFVGRLTAEEMATKVRERGDRIIVDASHPFAEEASKNAQAAAKLAGVPYCRYERTSENFANPLITPVETYDEAAEVALARKGNVMLLTGSKTLQVFAEKLVGIEGIRMIARMLPRLDNMEKCAALGVEQKNIIAMQGPFSRDLNEALYKQFDTTLMITKESGKAGAVDEKITAALDLGIEVVLITRPKIQYDNAFDTFIGVEQFIGGILHDEQYR
ncbi:precorrin-6A reductase [Kurthia huakuii]|uniref:precorrin-6A reductase n=1 Tax=Kurthia huakuii TaxID=1421019 RepID=UPI0004970AD9|nr:precorrin-6A reductase [Kurthia huakuii]MBM7699458.1 precorrin-6A/cobalt-precorrin-6A reductase [Kurthia huakuii]